MFESIDRRGHAWRSYAVHTLLVVFVVPIVGLGNFRLTPFLGAATALLPGRRLEGGSIALAWIPAFVLFALAGLDPIGSWDASWAQMSRWLYFRNTMFGPNCSGTECLYTVATAILTGGIGYSVAGYIAQKYWPSSPWQMSGTTAC